MARESSLLLPSSDNLTKLTTAGAISTGTNVLENNAKSQLTTTSASTVFDERLVKALAIAPGGDLSFGNDGLSLVITRPYTTGTNNNGLGFYGWEYFESENAVYVSAWEKIEELRASMGGVSDDDATFKLQKDAILLKAKERVNYIKSKVGTLKSDGFFRAPFSMVHPYALLKLAGGVDTRTKYLFDAADKPKWYEVDSDIAGYSKNPTTSQIILWGRGDNRGRFPYAYTDFVFCKYWNRIQNNRMITLRRYPMPVTDNVEPGNYTGGLTYDSSGENSSQIDSESPAPFAPMCTAITYFGEGTENKLSNILSFSAGYKWKELEGNVWQTSSQQPEEGQITGPATSTWFSGALQTVSKVLGLMSDYKGEHKINPQDAAGLPPDPYHSGPYENRILGPVNVINHVWARDRELYFSADGLTITFSYMSRPISHVNNKAIMLDLLANIMLMISSSGTFFGGLHRYRNEKPAIYPWRNTGTLNALYKGQLFGKNGAVSRTLKEVFNEGTLEFVTNFAKDMFNSITNAAKELVAKITKTEYKAENRTDAVKKMSETAQRAVAAKYLKGATIPWLTGAKAILTGDPVGDWHLTIGNPLNPIAMIGNLIVEKGEVTFSDELGPDDFPIGFDVKITLKHGMGRDRDAIESMFNRGAGRLYSLPQEFVSSADNETHVDAYTGDTKGMRTNTDAYKAFLQTSGSDFISQIGNSKLANSGSADKELTKIKHYNLDLGKVQKYSDMLPTYVTAPWAIHYTL